MIYQNWICYSHPNPLLQFFHLSQCDTIFYLLKLKTLVSSLILLFPSHPKSGPTANSLYLQNIFRILLVLTTCPTYLPDPGDCHLPTWITAVVSSVLSWFCLCSLILVEMLVNVCPSTIEKSSRKCLSQNVKAEVFSSFKRLNISISSLEPHSLSPNFHFTAITLASLIFLNTLSINLPQGLYIWFYLYLQFIQFFNGLCFFGYIIKFFLHIWHFLSSFPALLFLFNLYFCVEYDTLPPYLLSDQPP